MDRQSLLQEVNKLVSTGLRQSALDLLSEYLESYPTDPFVLSALGRIYLLEKRPDQAIKYLQASLSHRNDKSVYVHNEYTHCFDNLDNDDLSYIENSETGDEPEYLYGSEDLIQCREISNASAKLETDYETTEIIDSFESQTINEFDSKNSRDEPDLVNTFDIESEIVNEFWPDHSIRELKSNQVIDDEEFDSLFHSDGFEDPFHDEIAALSDLIDEYEEEDDIVEDALVNEEEKSIEDEFDWDVVEDFDDIDEPDSAPSFQDDRITTDGKVNRIDRAKQIATEVIHAYDWGIQNLGLLQQVFYENGWAAARVAIEHELTRGLTPDELELAIFVRRLWTENQQYWISFRRITSNQPAQQTDAAYKCMSWREALRIIRVFDYTPSEEEIQLFVDDIYDDWYCSPSLQRQYKAFIRYLKYRTGTVRHTLPATEWFSFVTAYEDDKLVDLSWNEIRHANGLNFLMKQGIDLEKILQDLEQKYNVVKPPITDEENFYLMHVSESESNSKSKSKPKAILNDEDDDSEEDDFKDLGPPPNIKPKRFTSPLEAIYGNKNK